MSHSMFTLLCALLLAAVTAVTEKRTPRERVWVATRTFVCCVTTVMVGSWLMYAIHG